MPSYVFGFKGSTPSSVGALMTASSALLNAKTFSGKGHLRVVYTGDSRSDNTKKPINTTVLRKVLKQAVSKNPDLILFGGDMGKVGGTSTLKSFIKIASEEALSRGVPLFVIPGNHEYYGDSGLDDYLQWIGLPNFIIRIPAYHFQLYALNNVLEIKSKEFGVKKDVYGFAYNTNKYNPKKPYHLLNVSLKTLNDEVKKHKQNARNTVFAMHAAPSFAKWEQALAPAYRQPNPKYEYLFVQGRNTKDGVPGLFDIANNHARFVVASHLHVRTTSSGAVKRGKLPTIYLISGNAGAALEPGVLAKNQTVFREVPNFVLFTMTPSSITGEFFQVT